MADTRISALTRLPEAGVSPTDLLPIADLSASETKAITAKDLLEGVVINMDAGSIPASKIDLSAGITSNVINVTQGNVVLGRISGAGKAEEIACTAAGRALLDDADAAAQRATLQLGSLAVRSGSWVDGSSFSGTSSGTNTGDQTIVLTGPVTGTGTGAIATSISGGAVGSVQLATGAVTNDKLAIGSVSASKLADQSAGLVVNGAPSSAGSFIGQTAFNEANGYAYTYTAAGWVQHAGVQSLTVTESDTPLLVTYTSGTSSTINLALDSQPVNTVWAGPATGPSGLPVFRKLVGLDLPAATGTIIGAVKPGEGTQVVADGTFSLKPATATTLGGVKVTGTALTLDASGVLTHSVSPLTAGAYVKVITDDKGHVVGGLTQLGNAEISGIDASKINTGILSPARIGDGSILKEKLGNYSTTIIQEADPGPGNYVGQFWYRESDAQLKTWSNNSWIPVGSLGKLGSENLRFCGTFNAATGGVEALTTFGVTAGLVAGATIPLAADTLTGVYLVCTTPGVFLGQNYDNGDWVLCLGTGAGKDWQRVDTLSGTAGGVGTIRLDDLLDVSITTPQSGDSIVYDATSGRWVNRTTHGVKLNLIEAFDGLRTSFTTSRAIVSQNNLLMSVGGVIQEPGIDFTAVAGSSTINFATPPPTGIDYWILQEASIDGGGGGGGASLSPGTAANELLGWDNALLDWKPVAVINGGSY